MRGLDAADILRVWELGLAQHPLDRAMAILSAGCPELPYEDLVALPIGQRDARLLAVYTLTFGARIDARTRCPACQELVEFTLDAQELSASSGGSPGQGVLQAGEVEVRFRLPNSLDLAAVAGLSNVADARRSLALRCVTSVLRDGQPAPAEALTDDVLSALAGEMASLDPQGVIELDLRCPSCNAAWQAVFDIMVQFWAEIVAAARRLMVEVHRLATAYGWREPDILALSAARRGIYLEMVG